MMEGLKKRTRKAFGIRKKEKDTDSTGSPDRDGIPSPHEPPYNSKAECAREGGKKVSKKSNGAPNGFYAEIDWERYNSPELDEEGYSIRPEEPGLEKKELCIFNCVLPTKGKHFYSSSESEEEEESHKKFNIKIKPLQSKDILKNAATVDELKASIGNIALSPSPVRKSPRRSPGAIKRNLSSEEVARPRRSTPTPELVSKKPPDDTMALAPLFGPPLESAFDEQKTEVLLDQPEIWGSGQPINPSIESPKLTRPFPTGTPPPLPPKNVPATPPRTGSPLTIGPGASSPARPSTPLVPSSSTTPPPPPPRPPSRPKLPPGKPGVGDVPRPFSPPIHSSSPPPIAPLARAESTSSISSTNSLSAATTPTVGSSRGPSPLTMGAQDTLPVAAAFTETVNAYFKGADPSKCIVKITGEMVLSFPAGITRHFANNPSPAALTFRVINFSRLEHVLPNPQLLCCDNTQNDANTKEFWVNMPNLMTHLKKVSEQKPQATYYNVDMLKYQVSAQGIQSTPLNLAVNWRCEPASTDLRIDYKYNTDAMTTAVALNNVQFLVPIDGGVTKLQAVLPPAVWNAEQQRILWKIPDISQKSENGGVGSLLARFQLSEGPSKPSPLVVQFTSEGSTLSGCDIELVGAGYRFSLIKKRFAAGKYLADN
uniref:SH3-containing GRB2-like protein 3-interacting protein 1 n=1 Tax=Rousettus aegyptiacus TaxID=9407 RepID=A0A7J8KGM6_ROUAE|nr:SH3GL interacting endocytic adaptor 1 [Rousettus aegyptiacus]